MKFNTVFCWSIKSTSCVTESFDVYELPVVRTAEVFCEPTTDGFKYSFDLLVQYPYGVSPGYVEIVESDGPVAVVYASAAYPLLQGLESTVIHLDAVESALLKGFAIRMATAQTYEPPEYCYRSCMVGSLAQRCPFNPPAPIPDADIADAAGALDVVEAGEPDADDAYLAAGDGGEGAPPEFVTPEPAVSEPDRPDAIGAGSDASVLVAGAARGDGGCSAARQPPLLGSALGILALGFVWLSRARRRRTSG